ncbi:MAG: dienelactone hydrolase [Actinomycetia bacterium]|nr:dienelactone hydrolase [Actinomycetes bacterium]
MNSPAKALLLTPGSGGSCDHQTLVQLESELEASSALSVTRYEFEYRRAGKRSSGRADRLVGELTRAVRATANGLGIETTAMVIGGRSMGGRVCSMAVADGLDVAGLLLLSYPLHPPGAPDNLRIDHWNHVSVPTLFISSDNDRFGRPAEFEQHFDRLGCTPTTRWLSGGGHDPKRIDHRRDIVDQVATWIDQLGE